MHSIEVGETLDTVSQFLINFVIIDMQGTA